MTMTSKSKSVRTNKSKRGRSELVNDTTDQNVGRSCLQTIASIWQVDDSAVKWVDGGFDWAPGSHLVRVRAERNEGSGEDRWRVSVTTDFLTTVPIEELRFIETVA